MYLPQAYQAELLGDQDEGGGCGPNAVYELRQGHRFVSQGYGSTGGHWETFMVESE